MDNFTLASKDDIKDLKKIISNNDVVVMEKVDVLKSLGNIALGDVVIAYDGNGNPYVYLDMDINHGYYKDWRRSPARRLFVEINKNINDNVYVLSYTAHDVDMKALIHKSYEEDLLNEDKICFGNLEINGVSYDILKICHADEYWSQKQKLEKPVYINVETEYGTSSTYYTAEAAEPISYENDNTDPQNQNVESLF